MINGLTINFINYSVYLLLQHTVGSTIDIQTACTCTYQKRRHRHHHLWSRMDGCNFHLKEVKGELKSNVNRLI